MAKKKNKKRGRPQAPLSENSAAAKKKILELIAQGRSMRALRLAKESAKSHPGPESEVILAQAYQARIKELLASGMQKEARELVLLACRRFPESPVDWHELSHEVALKSGDLDLVLTEWADAHTDPNRRRELTEILRREMIDPRVVAESDALAETDPLKQSARAVWSAFTEAAAGRLSPSTRAGLRCVPRRSPLSDWRNFTLALAAFYDAEDAVASKSIALLPADSALAPAGGVLLALLGDRQAEKQLALPARLLVNRSGNEDTALLNLVTRLLQGTSQNENQGHFFFMSSLMKLLAAKNPFLAKRLALWGLHGGFASTIGSDHDSDSLLAPNFPLVEIKRLKAVAAQKGSGLDAFILWFEWLRKENDNQFRHLPDIKLALFLDQLAELAEEGWEHTIATFEFFGLEPPDLSDLQGLKCMLSNLLHEGMLEPDFELLPALPFLTCTSLLLTYLYERTESKPQRKKPAVLFSTYACRLDPTPNRFRRLLRAGAQKSSAKAKLLAEWSEKFPRDPEPLRLLADQARRRSAFRKALGFLDRAAALDPLDEKIRRVRFEVLVDTFLLHLHQNKHHLATRDLDQLQKSKHRISREQRLFLLGARHHLADEMNDPDTMKATTDELIALAGDRYVPAEVLNLIRGIVWEKQLPPSLEPSGRGNQARLSSLVRLLRLARAVRTDYLELFCPEIQFPGAKPEELPAEIGDLLLICEFALWAEDQDILHLASGAGLLLDGPTLPVFLRFRLESAESPYHFEPWWDDVFQLTMYYARRYQSQEVLAQLNAKGFYRGDEDPISPTKAARLLASERLLQGRLDQRKKPARRKGSGRKQPSIKRKPDRGRRGPGPGKNDRTGFLPFPDQIEIPTEDKEYEA